jgi:fructokinase
MMDAAAIYGGVEAGGTKFVCAVGSGPANLLAETRFPTTTPEETIGRTLEFFRPFVRSGQAQRIGLASFGPVDLEPGSASYGSIVSTPKPGWSHTNIRLALHDGMGVAVEVDTDVNAAALAEFLWGAARGLDPSLYLTVGTGIGGGLIKDGRPYHGLLSPEMGHLRIPHDFAADPFSGACPFHGDCFEGLASGPAIEKRLGRRGETLSDDDPFWELEAGYIAAALANCVLTISPRILILGGGVMQRPAVWPHLRRKIQALLNGYVQSDMLVSRIDEYIVPPGLGARAGVLGAIALARLGDLGGTV